MPGMSPRLQKKQEPLSVLWRRNSIQRIGLHLIADLMPHSQIENQITGGAKTRTICEANLPTFYCFVGNRDSESLYWFILLHVSVQFSLYWWWSPWWRFWEQMLKRWQLKSQKVRLQKGCSTVKKRQCEGSVCAKWCAKRAKSQEQAAGTTFHSWISVTLAIRIGRILRIGKHKVRERNPMFDIF